MGFIIEYIILVIYSYFTADSTFTLPDISLDPVVHAPAPQAPTSPAPPSATPLLTHSHHSTPPAPTLLSTPPAQTGASRLRYTLRYTSGTESESDSSSSSYRPPTPPILSLLESDYPDEDEGRDVIVYPPNSPL